MRVLLLLFIVIPLLEMMLLFEVADVIGGLSTVGLVVLTAVIGIQILKSQGLSTLLRAQNRLQSGELPAQEIVEGMMLAAAGALLLTPGFVTDILGFVFLASPMRKLMAKHTIHSGIVATMGNDSDKFKFWSANLKSSSRYRHHGNIYEGEYSEDELSQINQKEPKNDFEDESYRGK
ncbi:MAG: biotin--acetyl-CoA-carboxylase ligase [Gammaproteobacteria bacterium]|nr:biotin--acetyl-CoA-carboxylase ligase [Gammaproteobacteria bacterium]